MKKILFASAFALFGTFAMANEVNVELQEESVSVENIVEIVCIPRMLSCGVEDCWNLDTEQVYTMLMLLQDWAEQDAESCANLFP